MTKTFTFNARLMSYGPTPDPSGFYNGDIGWNATIDGQDDHSGERTTAHLKIHGYSACPFGVSNENARIRITVEVIEPKTRVVPWKAEEVPLGCQIRLQGQTSVRYTLTCVTDAGVDCCGTHWGFKTLAGRYEHSTDGGKTWAPAGRVDEVCE